MATDPYLLCPVLLGDGRHARRIARTLFWQSGLRCRLFSRGRTRLLTRLSPYIFSHALPASLSAGLTVQALLDFAAEQDFRDCIPVLFLCDGVPGSLFTGEQLAALETVYLLARPGDEQDPMALLRTTASPCDSEGGDFP